MYAVLAPASLLLLASPVLSAPPGFWEHWGDGRAELSGYALTQERYGQTRQGGRAVLIYVTETFSRSLRVKADPGKHPPEDELPVVKLNINEHFQTGVYDYNLMTSAFCAVEGGALQKLVFSSQEWCGQMFETLWPQPKGPARHDRHSYFDGEADDDTPFALGDAFTADELFISVRGLGRPLKDGALHVVPRLKELRLLHRPMEAIPAVCAQSASTQKRTVPAGTFEVQETTVTRADGVVHRYWVEVAAPHRLVAWDIQGQEHAELTGSFRDAYWVHHNVGDEALLRRLGLPVP
jgi:hypothetical protein